MDDIDVSDTDQLTAEPEAVTNDDRKQAGEYKKLSSLLKPPLLMGETASQFDALCAAVTREIGPQGIIDQMDVSEVLYNMCEIIRTRLCIANLIQINRREAIVILLSEDLAVVAESEAQVLAMNWSTSPQARNKVDQLLKEQNLDRSAIEAIAMKNLGSELQMLERRLESLERGRSKALRNISKRRKGLSRRVRQITGRVIEGHDVIPLAQFDPEGLDDHSETD